MRDRNLFVGLPMWVVVFLMGAWLASAGNLDPPAGPVSPTMHTLDEIHDLVAGGGGSSGCGAGFPGEARASAEMTISDIGDPFEVLGLQHDIVVPTEPQTCQTGAIQHGAMTITKNIDASSPLLHQAQATGTILNEATLRLNDSLSNNYFTVNLNNVRIEQISTVMQQRCGGEFAHIEEVSLRYSEITWLHELAGIAFQTNGCP